MSPTPAPAAPRPADPPVLFATLLAARVAGDRALESLARGWLAEAGIRVVFATNLGRPPKANPHSTPTLADNPSRGKVARLLAVVRTCRVLSAAGLVPPAGGWAEWLSRLWWLLAG